MRKGLTEIVFILDRSGSMAGLESDTIGGFNGMLKKQREEDKRITNQMLMLPLTVILNPEELACASEYVNEMQGVGFEYTLNGTAADIIKLAMNDIYIKLKEKNLKSKLVMQVHDELIIEKQTSQTT